MTVCFRQPSTTFLAPHPSCRLLLDASCVRVQSAFHWRFTSSGSFSKEFVFFIQIHPFLTICCYFRACSKLIDACRGGDGALSVSQRRVHQSSVIYLIGCIRLKSHFSGLGAAFLLLPRNRTLFDLVLERLFLALVLSISLSCLYLVCQSLCLIL